MTEPNETNDDLELQRKLAKDWRPDVEGPLVGPVSPTTDFVADFSESDPRRSKIQTLAAEFPTYRSMKRDGSCGYRALAFGFLFNLCHPECKDLSDAVLRLRLAATQFQDLQQLFAPRGWDLFIYEDWLAACVGLCTELAGLLEKKGKVTTGLSASSGKGGEGDASSGSTEQSPKAVLNECGALLSKRLNDEQETGVEVLQYLRATTSSWMLAHDDDFAPFVVTDSTDGVKAWCELNVDPPTAEMEEQSLLAFYQAIVEPTGMALRVHYLEQSAGDRLQVSTYEPSGETKGSPTEVLPAVNLLYRP